MSTGELNKPVCVTVFGPSSPARLRHEVENAARAAGYEISDRILTPNVDLDRPHPLIELVGAIAGSDCVVVDLTYIPPSVYYHIGIAHAAGKRLILLIEKGKRFELPLVFQTLTVIDYRTDPNRFNVQPARIKAAFHSPISAPAFRFSPAVNIDWDRLEKREAENLCLELLTQLGYRKADWYKESKDIDLVAELPKKDPDGYEYRELWLVSIALWSDKIPPEMLLDMFMHEPEYLLHRALRENNREDETKYSGVTLLVINLSESTEIRRELERLYDRSKYRRRYPPMDSLRFRVWDRTYLTNLVRQFPQIGYKYFSDEARSVSKYRKTPEELYEENIRLTERQARMNSELQEEKKLRVSAERDAIWKDISFSAAHKLGNPIFAVETFLIPARKRIEENRNAEALEVLDKIGSSVEDAKAIVQQFKELSKTQRMSFAPVRLLPILQQSCEVASSQNVECTVECPDIEIRGDATRLKECFDELVANSLKWFDKPERRITINVTAPLDLTPDSPLSFAEISYEDNGPGIPYTNKQRIFDAFFSTRTDGTGLGLALVRRIIEGHGGSIIELGRPGFGATFDIMLPMNFAEDDEPVLPGLEGAT